MSGISRERYTGRLTRFTKVYHEVYPRGLPRKQRSGANAMLLKRFAQGHRLFLLMVMAAAAQWSGTGASDSEAESLQRFLQTIESSHAATYLAAFIDLNGDGRDEAIVHMLGSACGTGGCNTLVLTQRGTGWRVVTTVTITRPPIRVLDTESSGWRDIAVWVQGGGIQRGYESVLQFNGTSYPRNPTVAPVHPAPPNAPGKIVISSQSKAVQLYK
jgi:hypothetical protein